MVLVTLTADAVGQALGHLQQMGLLDVPNPGGGTPPPGSEKFLTLLKWGAWLAVAVCVAGVLYAAAKMAIDHQHGRGGGEGTTRLAWVLISCVVIGSASAFVGALV